jgi:hypothetical protein
LLCIGATLIICMTALAYVSAMRCGFIWDDDDYIVNRTVVQDPAGLD